MLSFKTREQSVKEMGRKKSKKKKKKLRQYIFALKMGKKKRIGW